MNLEHHRKQAKRLLRGHRAGEAEAVRRADAVLGERASERFQLSDAQHVVAVEAGHRSWPELRSAVTRSLSAPDDGRAETVVDTGLEYRPGEPVLVRVIRRGQHSRGVAEEITDDGAAVAKAGSPPVWHTVVERVLEEFHVNISRHGVVWLPVVPVGAPEEEIVRRIGQASLALYQEILDLEA